MGDNFENPLTNYDPDHNYDTLMLLDQNNLFSMHNSVDEFLETNQTSLNDKNFLSIFCQNIRSMNRNLDSFLNLFPNDNMPDIFILSETWHSLSSPLNIPGYMAFHTVRDGRAGGVTILAKYHLNVEKI